VWRLARIVCDTSFLIALASRNIKNISSLGTEIGDLEFVVPDMVISELERVAAGSGKKKVQPLRPLKYRGTLAG